jgi:phage baseplate assembly protein W
MSGNGATNPLLREIVFSDVNYSFTPHPVTGKLPVVKNEDAIKRAIRANILTNFGERPYLPDFGGNIIAMLFENANDPLLDEVLVAQIENSVLKYEPRAKLIETNVSVKPDQNGINVTIRFLPVNSRLPVELDVEIERVR